MMLARDTSAQKCIAKNTKTTVCIQNCSLFFIQWNLKLAVLLPKICMQHNLFLCLYFKVNMYCLRIV
jgi:hypothetical protein